MIYGAISQRPAPPARGEGGPGLDASSPADTGKEVARDGHLLELQAAPPAASRGNCPWPGQALSRVLNGGARGEPTFAPGIPGRSRRPTPGSAGAPGRGRFSTSDSARWEGSGRLWGPPCGQPPARSSTAEDGGEGQAPAQEPACAGAASPAAGARRWIAPGGGQGRAERRPRANGKRLPPPPNPEPLGKGLPRPRPPSLVGALQPWPGPSPPESPFLPASLGRPPPGVSVRPPPARLRIFPLPGCSAGPARPGPEAAKGGEFLGPGEPRRFGFKTPGPVSRQA
uniref:basic proline-rich protein-like n=1 Tax=Euleptes europaea TaxID=460621 RepID=UPI00253FA814|nr:basic proline-rich protein-like [Euleptes europaea]